MQVGNWEKKEEEKEDSFELLWAQEEPEITYCSVDIEIDGNKQQIVISWSRMSEGFKSIWTKEAQLDLIGEMIEQMENSPNEGI